MQIPNTGFEPEHSSIFKRYALSKVFLTEVKDRSSKTGQVYFQSKDEETIKGISKKANGILL